MAGGRLVTGPVVHFALIELTPIKAQTPPLRKPTHGMLALGTACGTGPQSSGGPASVPDRRRAVYISVYISVCFFISIFGMGAGLFRTKRNFRPRRAFPSHPKTGRT